MCANEKTLATTKLVCWLTPCGHTFKGAKGGVGALGAVKILALPKKGGGLTYAKIFWWICRCIPKTLLRHHSAQIMIIYPPKSEHFSPKIDHHQQLVNIYPKSNHSLPKMVIYALFTSKCRIYALLSSNPPECQDWGRGSSQSWQCQYFHGAYFGHPSFSVWSLSRYNLYKFLFQWLQDFITFFYRDVELCKLDEKAIIWSDIALGRNLNKKQWF